ncbi:hypothetical protein FF38_13595 [Lucilia cuprina]|uniref:Uncharacterized protein n=1 Tax=Lucilia cuprina TaxID=7375 RepID=A0A0L0BQV6_LUCCU|nr:hypothetical protein FF38_13595 [Lucilia cuprina]
MYKCYKYLEKEYDFYLKENLFTLLLFSHIRTWKKQIKGTKPEQKSTFIIKSSIKRIKEITLNEKQVRRQEKSLSTIKKNFLIFLKELRKISKRLQKKLKKENRIECKTISAETEIRNRKGQQ